MQIYAASYLIPVNAPPLAGGALAVHQGRIVAVGTLAEVRRTWGGTVREFPGSVIIPGLVNPHTHLELTHFLPGSSGRGSTIPLVPTWIG